jgi:hypothetical protein
VNDSSKTESQKQQEEYEAQEIRLSLLLFKVHQTR